MKLFPVVTVVAACVIVGAVLLMGPRHSNQRADSTVPTQREDSRRAPAPAVARPPVAPDAPQRMPAPTPAPTPEVARPEALTTRPDVGSATRTPVPTPPPSAAPRSPEDERYLSDLQHDKLTKLLDPRAVAAQSVTMVTMSGDAEARRYADEIASAPNVVGWSVLPARWRAQFEGVRIRANPKVTAAATRLQQALAATGIDVSLEFTTNVADIQLLVGRR